MTLQWQTEFRPGVRKAVHVSACNVLRTRKPVFTKRQPAKVLSRALFLKRSAAPRPTIRARQTVRALPRFAARWDSHHLEIPRDTSPYCLHSALCLQPACYLQPLYDFFAHNSPLTLLPPQEQHTPVRQRKATKQHPPPPHIRPRGDTTPQP